MSTASAAPATRGSVASATAAGLYPAPAARYVSTHDPRGGGDTLDKLHITTSTRLPLPAGRVSFLASGTVLTPGMGMGANLGAMRRHLTLRRG